ncbi:beta,beta-carotene 15,15'-dioxygenase-like [Littorina saxatilis]|uniref:Uncharacterized protein n=1 Tax=Littorina saxatilis TaxID=31220 RepID=A0AAN9G9X1_9CAEN
MAAKAEDDLDTTSEPLPQWMTLDKDSDTKTPVDTEVTGTIPKWLDGNLYRNGSGVYSVGDQQLDHLFDGFAVIHRFIIHDGEVKYQSRILDTDTWVKSCKANRLVVSQFAAYAYPDPCKGMFDKMTSYLLPLSADNMTDNTAVNIVEYGDKLYAMTETTLINEVDPQTLLRKTKVDLRDTVAVHIATAHPHFDTDGTMYNLGTCFNPTSAYSIVSIPPPQPGVDGAEAFKQATLLTAIPSRFNMHISYNHSFGMSENFFVVLEQPITLNILKVVTTNWRREGFASNFVKFPEETIAFNVIRRSDNSLLPVTFQADTTFCFHFVNCYEVEEHLVVDFCGYEDINIIDDLYLKNVMSAEYKAKIPPATFRRYVLPYNVTEAEDDVNLVQVAGSKATAYMKTPGIIHLTPDYITDDKIRLELPRINYQMCNGKKYRYAYGTSILMAEERLMKVDLEQRKIVEWNEVGYSPGEPVFVPKPGAKAEDDGVILSPVLSNLPNTPSYLLVLDAKTFKEVGRAIAPCDVKMAMSFHGSFVEGQDFGSKSSAPAESAHTD